MKKENTRKRKLLTKLIRVMKLTALLLFGACLHLSAATYAQRISLSEQNASLSSIFAQIEKQSNYTFAYTVSMMKEAKPVSIDLSDVTLEEALEQCFKGQPFTYAIIESTIVLTPLSEIEISGKVTDSEGKALPSATVMIKGTFTGVTTNVDGEYSITVPDSKTVLVFSYVGFAKQEIIVDNKTTINVTLEQSATELEGVTINAGYYTVKEREKTGNISRIDAKQIENQTVTTPLQALQGRMPGVNIFDRSGVPGGGVEIQIRGRNSIRDDGNDPLFIVNGVPYPSDPLNSPFASSDVYNATILPINYINPADIESIEILKDADATAIYGSRGANGVVLITTKKGKSGKTTVTLDQSYSFGKVPKKIDMLTTDQYIEMIKESYASIGFDPIPDRIKPFLHDLFVWDQGRYTDWQEELIGGTSKRSNTQLSISGGNATTNYLFNGSYYKETTVYPGDFALKRGAGLLTLNHQSIDRKLNASFSVNYVFQNSNLPTAAFARQAFTLVAHSPEPFDEEGNHNFEEYRYGPGDPPYAALSKAYKGITRNLITNTSLAYKILPALNLKLDAGYSYVSMDEIRKIPISAQNPRNDPTGGSVFGNAWNETWSIEPQIAYKKNIGAGVLRFLGGISFQSSTNEKESITAWGYSSDALLDNIQAAPNTNINRTSFSEYKYNAIFGRLNYNYKEKYILNLTGRRDGSSRFGAGKQFANFGAIGAAWIFSNESFVKNSLGFLSFGKLRASYGVTGSDQIGDYQYLESYSPTRYAYVTSVGLIPTRLANPEFGWETVRKFELALELGFFEERLYLAASYYRNRSSNQLVGKSLAGTTGFGSVQSNFPATVQNKGLEIEISSQNIHTKNVKWTTSFNISFERNKLVVFPGIEGTPFDQEYVVGESMFNRKGFRYIGVDPETGLYEYEDVNDDGRITSPEDLQPGYNISVDYYGGLNNSISYKGLQLDFFFQFKKQTGRSYLGIFGQPGGTRKNFPAFYHENRWQNPGDITDIQKYSWARDARDPYRFGRTYRGTNFIQDASYIRLQSVSLAYDFPKKVIKKLGVQNLRLYVQGQNLFTITNYIGLDPNAVGALLPPLRFITAGINVKF